MSRTTQAAIYARVSTHEQNVNMQLDALRKHVMQQGWKLAEEYIDHGISGSAKRRPALNKLMKAIQKKKLDVVLVWRFDRFARSTAHLLEALEVFKQHKVDFISLREKIDTTTAAGKALFTLSAVFAEFERDLIRERVKAGMARAKAEGRHVGRPKVEMPVEAAQELLAAGHSLSHVARMLKVSRTSLRRALKSQAST